MKSTRKAGAKDWAVRALLLDATEKLMLEEGYAAVTSRRLAARAGLTQPLLYYYFRTMDELFLAVFQRMAQQSLERLERALASEQPLRALWNLMNERSRTALTIEFMALANHRKVVRADIARLAEKIRSMEVSALSRLFEDRGIEPKISPLVAMVLMTTLSHGLVLEKTLGILSGHADTRVFVDACLRRVEEACEVT